MTASKDDFPEIKRELITKIDRMSEIMEGIAKEQSDHRDIIYGNPVKKIRGLSERLNSVEDSNVKKDQWNLAMIPLVIIMVLERVWFHITGHPK